MNMKKMSQQDFDKYIVFTLLPEVEDEYENITYIILTKKGKFQFAKECEVCHDLVLVDKEYDIPKEILNVMEDGLDTYLETLTGLDVIKLDEITECECFEDTVVDDGDDDIIDDPYDEYDDVNPEDLYDDYEEY